MIEDVEIYDKALGIARITLQSDSRDDFLKWLEWAYRFAEQLEASGLTGEQKRMVKRIMNMRELSD